MKRFFPLLIVLLLALSCSHSGGRVIPERTLVKIYADMALADRWIDLNRDLRAQADTSMVYEAIFAKYGYNTEDYLKSVRYYMNKPDDLSYIVEKAKARLEKKAREYNAKEQKSLEEGKNLRQKELKEIRKEDD